MRMNVPTGVCRSASTDLTTGTTLPCRASRSNASNDEGCRSSMLASNHTVGGEPLPAIDYEHGAVDITRCVRTNEDCCFLDVGNASEAPERNFLFQSLLHRLRHEALHSFSIFNWTRRDCVHANSVRSPFDGEIARQCVNTGL